MTPVVEEFSANKDQFLLSKKPLTIDSHSFEQLMKYQLLISNYFVCNIC